MHFHFKHVFFACVFAFACVYAYARASEQREWWGHSGIRPCKERLMGASQSANQPVLWEDGFTSAPGPIHHPLTSPDSCRAERGKGFANSLWYPLADFILWNHTPTGFTDDELGVTLRAFLHSERLPRVSDQPKSFWQRRRVVRGFMS